MYKMRLKEKKVAACAVSASEDAFSASTAVDPNNSSPSKFGSYTTQSCISSPRLGTSNPKVIPTTP